MSNRLGRALLREYIRESMVNEEISGLSGSGGWFWLPAYTGPMTGLWQPFVDVGKTAIAGAIDMTNRVWGLVKNTVELATSSVVPFAQGNFEQINKKTHSRTRAVINKFSEVFDRTDKTLAHNDLHAIAFMMNPGAYILTKLKPSKETMSAIKKGHDEDVSAAKRQHREKVTNLKRLYALFVGRTAIKSTSDAEDAVLGALGGSGPEKALGLSAGLGRANRTLLEVTEAELRDTIDKSDLTREMQQAARQIVTERVNNLVMASKVLDNVRTLEDLQKALGKDLNISQFDDIEDSAEPGAAQKIIGTARDELKKLYSSTLKSEMKRLSSTEARGLASIYQAGLSQMGGGG